MQKEAANQPIKPQKLFGLDHLRALAIIMVFVYHYGRIFPHPEWTNTISGFGWAGVDLFFVLSGYLIASQLFASLANKGSISLKEFFTKRSFRILPAYFVVVILYFLFPFLREREALAPLWKYLTFTQNIELDLRTQGTFSHAWSLCIEEQFYLLFPFILIALQRFGWMRRGAWLLLLLFLFGFAARVLSWHTLVAPHTGQDDFWVYWQEWIYYPTFCRLDGLLFGVSIAAVFQYRPKWKFWLQKKGNNILIMAVAVSAGAYFLYREEQTFATSIFGFPLVDFICALLVLAALSPATFLYRISSKWTTKLAALSFAVYLTHKIIIHVSQAEFAKLHIAEDGNLMFLLCICTCAAAAFLLNEVVEKPFLTWRKRVLKKEAGVNRWISNTTKQQ